MGASVHSVGNCLGWVCKEWENMHGEWDCTVWGSVYRAWGKVLWAWGEHAQHR